MNKSIAVKVKNLSKTYKLYHNNLDRLKEALLPTKKRYYKEFHALKDVSFDLKKGETLGIIGKNGNGKSTLLKIIAGVLNPTSGRVISKGKIAAILELTSSLKPEFTGLENIYFNLRLNGYTGEHLEQKVQEVIDFSELDEFINQPVKTYSSGMKSRLGFGIATSIEPDILILDEVLAVGDFIFQQKCLSKINSMRESMSILFVSHSMNSIKLFCDRVIVLEKGQIAFNGSTNEGIEFFFKNADNAKLTKSTPYKTVTKNLCGQMFNNENKILNVTHKWNKNYYKLDEEMILDFSFQLTYKPKKLIIGLPFWDELNNYITSYNTDYYTQNDIFEGKTNITGRIKIPCYFNPGEYASVIVIVDGSEYLYRQRNENFIVANKDRVFGFVSLPHKWEID